MSNTPKFSIEQYEYLIKVFPRLEITLSTSEREIFLKTGHKQVLDIVKANIGTVIPKSLRDDR